MLSLLLFQLLVFLLVLTVVAFFFGEYMAKVFMGERTFLSPLIVPLEKLFYRCCGIDPEEEMTWTSFAFNLFWFMFLGGVVLCLLLYFQEVLPFNPEKFSKLRWDEILNTAISFVTNTNWQPYVSEMRLGYLVKMLGLGAQNFLAAAISITVAIALINGFIRKNTTSLGNFWVYLIRTIFYILLPLALIFAFVFLIQGMPNNLNPYVRAKTLEGKEQIIAQGPVAAQVAIKQLGTSGGGFFAANSAHPYENPTPFTDLLNVLAFMIIAAAFPFAFGAMLKDRAQGWAIFIAMLLLFCLGLGLALWTETQGNPLLSNLGIEHGINLEGKEMRFGIRSSVIFANAATATATGASNSAFVSFMPFTKLILMFNASLGEVIFGGAGSGFVGMLFYIMFATFLVGLMIGRSAEAYSKKLDTNEMFLVAVALFLPAILQLILSSLAMFFDFHVLNNLHNVASRISEIFYTYISTINNNGAMVAHMNLNTKFYNVTTAFAMAMGYIIKNFLALAIAGSLGRKSSTPQVARFPTTSCMFVLVLIIVILFVGISSFIPTLISALVAEYLYV